MFTAEQLINATKAVSGMPVGILKLPKEAMLSGKARLINELIMTRTARMEWLNDVDMARILDVLQPTVAGAPLPPGFDLKTVALPVVRSMEHPLLCALICIERLGTISY